MIDDDVAEIHHRHERLPAGENLGVRQARQQLGGFLELPRGVIVEGGGLHLLETVLPIATERKIPKRLYKPLGLASRTRPSKHASLRSARKASPTQGGFVTTGIQRRAVLTALAGAAVIRPRAARAQQPAMPVIGFFSSRSPGESAGVIAAFRQGLQQAGFVEGQNVVIAFRWAEGAYDR